MKKKLIIIFVTILIIFLAIFQEDIKEQISLIRVGTFSENSFITVNNNINNNFQLNNVKLKKYIFYNGRIKCFEVNYDYLFENKHMKFISERFCVNYYNGNYYIGNFVSGKKIELGNNFIYYGFLTMADTSDVLFKNEYFIKDNKMYFGFYANFLIDDKYSEILFDKYKIDVYTTNIKDNLNKLPYIVIDL